MSNANPSPSPRAANALPGGHANYNDLIGEPNQQNNLLSQRIEESKQNEFGINAYQPFQSDSIRIEPEIAGAFNSVE